ncbi:hypothetical protein NK718_18910 [Alsobacter sp. SYSU M60028]|uniref:Uncharacterized protein n=1 Tax=Alsobacter ponti TaxID=2962936 RepID=A0ABT1LHN1_9HYPH|nr:hypothetical protein [Alsobacter ponti]MCP8940601.1 hypothetical protein [Alsobacter ponti]
MSHFASDEDRQGAVDTITIAALMNAVHALHGEMLRTPETRQRMAAIELEVLRSVKQVDAGDFDYETQAAGLGEALKLIKAMFRYSHAMQAQVTAEA